MIILLQKLTKRMGTFRKRGARENISTRNTPSPSPRTRRNTENGNINLDPEHLHNLVQGRVHVRMKEDSHSSNLKNVLVHQVHAPNHQ